MNFWEVFDQIGPMHIQKITRMKEIRNKLEANIKARRQNQTMSFFFFENQE